MILGPITFRRPVIRSLSTSDGWNYASHDVIEGKPRKQAVGEESNDVTLECFFHAELLRVEETLAQLRALGAAHEVVTLQSPNGYVWGNFVIESVTVKPRWLLPDGTLMSANVSIALGDPGLVRDIVPKPVAVTGTSSPTRTTPKTEDTSAAPGTVTPAQIARRA